ncbi:hypothetical protein [Acidovorax sp. Root402]|uniref:hypothetical protein n=1 Tax=Acidovorax sp. Root402 TaxID=1736527 RepID=UPI0006F350B0|nr:hypothetical protein [Acidovorax sp. Root402]KQW24985.1 hypothetical protein ASC83_12780 [Acidovorax sp. Root402]
MNLKIMSDWDAMRLADVLTIAEAACCIVGVPTTRLGSNTMTSPYLDGDPTENGNGTENCEAVFRRVVEALLNSIKAKKLQPAKIYPGKSHGIRNVDAVSGGRWDPVEDIDAWSTLVEVDVLKAWLESRNVRPPFFYSEKSGEPDYLDPNHARYSGKLAASVRAWQAMEDENLRRSKSPLSAMTEWLETRYEEFGLIHRQDNIKSGYKLGQRNDGAIKQAAMAANWQPEGGATKTPTALKRPSPRR